MIRKTEYRKPLAIAAAAALLLQLLAFAGVGVGAGASWAAGAPEETTLYVPAEAQSFTIELSLLVGAQSFAGIEFSLVIVGEGEGEGEGDLKLTSYTKGAAYSKALDAPLVFSHGAYYFGFLSDGNDFAGGQIDAGTLRFDGYTGDEEATIVLSVVNVAQLTEGKKATNEASSGNITFTVRRGQPGDGGPTPSPGGTPEDASGAGGAGGQGAAGQGAATEPEAPAAGGPEETQLDDGQPTPLGLSLLKDHVQFIVGDTDGMVRPDADITRAETVTIFYRLIDDDEKSEPAPSAFEDVPDDEWYAQYVSYAAMKGIVLGYPEGGFHPEDQITRAEFATIISRFAPEAPASAAVGFTDVPADHWATQYIGTCYANGWVIGYPDGTFMPESPITRAEAVTILNRALGRGIEPEGIPSDAPSFGDLPEDHWAYAQILEASVTHAYAPSQSESE